MNAQHNVIQQAYKRTEKLYIFLVQSQLCKISQRYSETEDRNRNRKRIGHSQVSDLSIELIDENGYFKRISNIGERI